MLLKSHNLVFIYLPNLFSIQPLEKNLLTLNMIVNHTFMFFSYDSLKFSGEGPHKSIFPFGSCASSLLAAILDAQLTAIILRRRWNNSYDWLLFHQLGTLVQSELVIATFYCTFKFLKEDPHSVDIFWQEIKVLIIVDQIGRTKEKQLFSSPILCFCYFSGQLNSRI